MANTIYDFTEKNIGGKDIPLSQYEGKVVLIVNTASKCGFTPQFDGLEKLYQEYKDKGLVILGFPCNQFKEQDPGNNSEIEEFCRVNYGVTFPMFSKIDVNGADADPLYVFLKSQKSFAGFAPNHELTPVLEGILGEAHPDYKTSSDIVWNFTKFLVGRDGAVVERFEPTSTPDDLKAPIEKLL